MDASALFATNSTIKKWTVLLDVNTQKISQMLHELVNKTGSYSKLTTDQKEQLTADRPILQLAIEQSNQFVQDNYKLIYRVAKEVGAKVDDDYESIGAVALARAFYTYLDPTVTIAHYCCVLIKRDFYRIIRDRRNGKNKIWRTTVSADYNTVDDLAHKTYVVPDNEPADPIEAMQICLQDENRMANFIEKISKAASMNEGDKAMLKIIFGRNSKSNEWIQEFCKKSGLTLTKQAVYLRKDNVLRIVRRKIDECGMALFS
jgi:hypothetical protein